MVYNAICSVIGAVVGAGFASGREIMQFFSRFGSFSWVLALFSCALMTMLIYRLTGNVLETIRGEMHLLLRILWLMLYGTVGGGMAAAAGELAALTLPLRYARIIGMLVTLTVCAKMSGGTLRGMAWLGKMLLPVMVCAFFLCLRVPGEKLPQARPAVPPFLHAAGYCGLNAVLAAAVTAQAGEGRANKERWGIAVGSGLLFGGLLMLGNATLLPHATAMEGTALPVVALLRGFGKEGFYLSAAVLYLAVSTTLIASLRGMASLLPGKYKSAWAALMAAGGAVIGFQEIVAKAYPILGYLCLLSLLIPNGMKQNASLRYDQIGEPKKETKEKHIPHDKTECAL